MHWGFWGYFLTASGVKMQTC